MFHFYSIFDHLYCLIFYYYFISFITIVYLYICILYRTICIYKFYITISSVFISIVYCCIFILYSTICIYRVYITILSVFVSIVHGVCLYSISCPFLFYALKPFVLYNLFIYKRFHWLRKINQVSNPDRLTSYARKTNTKTKVIVSVGVRDSCIHSLSLSLSLSLSSQTLFVTHHSAGRRIIIQFMITYNKGILKYGAFRKTQRIRKSEEKETKEYRFINVPHSLPCPNPSNISSKI